MRIQITTTTLTFDPSALPEWHKELYGSYGSLPRSVVLQQSIVIGPTKKEEVHGLGTIIWLLGEALKKHAYTQPTEWGTRYENALSMYGQEITLANGEPFFGEYAYLEGDHKQDFQKTLMLIPEIITFPQGARTHVADGDADPHTLRTNILIAFNRAACMFDAFQNATIPIKVVHYPIGKIFGGTVTLEGTISFPRYRESAEFINPTPKQGCPQITTIVDLTHFTNLGRDVQVTRRNQKYLVPYFPVRFSQSRFPFQFFQQRLPIPAIGKDSEVDLLKELIELGLEPTKRFPEIVLLNNARTFAEKIYHKFCQTYGAQVHHWLQGAIGCTLYNILSLCHGSYTPSTREVTKNLTPLFMKTYLGSLLSSIDETNPGFINALLNLDWTYSRTFAFGVAYDKKINRRLLTAMFRGSVTEEELRTFGEKLCRKSGLQSAPPPALREALLLVSDPLLLAACLFLHIGKPSQNPPWLIRDLNCSIQKRQIMESWILNVRVEDLLSAYKMVANSIFCHTDKISAECSPGHGRVKLELRYLDSFNFDAAQRHLDDPYVFPSMKTVCLLQAIGLPAVPPGFLTKDHRMPDDDGELSPDEDYEPRRHLQDSQDQTKIWLPGLNEMGGRRRRIAEIK